MYFVSFKYNTRCCVHSDIEFNENAKYDLKVISLTSTDELKITKLNSNMYSKQF